MWPTETVKELIRHLRRDGSQHEARQMLGEAKVLQKDLIPLMKDYHGDKELFSIVLRYNYYTRSPSNCCFPIYALLCARAPFSLSLVIKSAPRSSHHHHQILKRLSPSKKQAEQEQRSCE